MVKLTKKPTIIEGLRGNFLNVLDFLDNRPFTTKEFIDKIEENHPSDWENILDKYGKRGKGSGNRYSSFSYIGQALKGFSEEGLVEPRPYVTSPDGWGNPIIRSWIKSVRSAINDIDQDDIGNDDPEYREHVSGRYVRDAKVREQVLKRAKGFCEECGQPGFLKPDGKPYLETHHVISLSEQGADKLHNVIALCATDHQRAHYAKDWKELNASFQVRLATMKNK
jgi:hypothetical protein